MKVVSIFSKKNDPRHAYYILTGPLLSAMHMLELSPIDKGLNLGMVRRTEAWAWSTYDYIGDQLSARDDEVVASLLTDLGEAIRDFDWDAVGEKARDGWDEAMAYYNESH